MPKKLNPTQALKLLGDNWTFDNLLDEIEGEGLKIFCRSAYWKCHVTIGETTLKDTDNEECFIKGCNDILVTDIALIYMLRVSYNTETFFELPADGLPKDCLLGSSNIKD